MQQPRLARVSLETVGFQHITDRLQLDPSDYTASKPLRRAFAQLPLDSGVAWTWAPRGSAVTLRDLGRGVLPGGTTQTHLRNLLVNFVVTYLTSKGHLALIEDEVKAARSLASKDPPMADWLGFGKHVYWYTTQPDIAVVRRVLANGLGFFQCMALAPSPDEWPPRKRLSTAQIERLAQSTDHVVVDAFDFWGYVIWSRSTTSH